MNKKLMRIISAVMAICLLACMIVPAASAMPQESADGSIKRISVVINGDAKTRRGICWYTTEKCGSDVEVMPLAKYNGSFDGALKFSGTCTKWKENYCHKVLAENLEPDTKYVYRVGDASTRIWSRAVFVHSPCRCSGGQRNKLHEERRRSAHRDAGLPRREVSHERGRLRQRLQRSGVGLVL